MKVWVVVHNFGSINEGVGVFDSPEDARREFSEYTGIEWTPERRWKEVGGEEYSQEYGECDVFEGEFRAPPSVCGFNGGWVRMRVWRVQGAYGEGLG